MRQSIRQCYGFRVACWAHPDATPVLDRFFGPPVADDFAPRTRTVTLVVDVVAGRGAESAAPPHTEEVIAADPIAVDTGNSRATLHPDTWTARVDLAREDLGDQVVWGRWLLERLFLYLVCRSPRHYPLHAGAVGLDGRVALISAPTGTGKSTLAFWSLHRGADLFGEDIMVRHMDDPEPRVWGHPRAVYLDHPTIARAPELAEAAKAPVDGGAKSRVELPPALASRLHPAAHLDIAAFLVRDGSTPGVSELDMDAAIDRCREDVSTAKTDPVVLAAVESDLRSLLSTLPIREVRLSEDLDDCLDTLRSAVRPPLPTPV